MIALRKMLTVARREFFAMVATKAFIFSLLMMPVLMAGGFFLAGALTQRSRVVEKRIVVYDGTGGKLLAPIQAAARMLAAAQADTSETAGDSGADGESEAEGEGSSPAGQKEKERPVVLRIHIEPGEAPVPTDAQRLEHSRDIRAGKLDAFIEIPPDILDVNQTGDNLRVRYYSQESPLSETRTWLQAVLADQVRRLRLEQLGMNPELVQQASIPVRLTAMGLVEETDNGVRKAEETNEAQAIFLPFGIMVLMFMVIMLAAQPMLEGVLDEKSNRVAELLLGSVNPFQLMMGKLLGNTAGSICIFAFYFSGAFVAAAYNGWTDEVPWHLAPWFVSYQILAVLLFSSVFMAVGASVHQLKEAQSLLLPVWLAMATPMFVWFEVVQDPNGTFAFWLSLFPPATPMVMMLRLGTDAPIPVWQVILSILVLLVASLFCVFVAGRIFRAGILWQGQTPDLRRLVRWALAG